MSKYVYGLFGIFLGLFLFFGYELLRIWPTGVVKATWSVETSTGSTIIIYLKEGVIDVSRLFRTRLNRLLYKDYTGRLVYLPVVLWEIEANECVKKCQVERSGDNIIIKFPFAEVTGASCYEFTPIKPPPPGTDNRTQQP
jgi:hypothetical protein